MYVHDRTLKNRTYDPTQIPLASNYARSFRDSRVDRDTGRRVRVCTADGRQRMHARRESNIILRRNGGVSYARARTRCICERCDSMRRAQGRMPNSIANPIQETSGTNGGSMFYRYRSRRSTDVHLESTVRILRVLSTVCKRIYGLAFVYRRPCYHFPRRLRAFSGRFADAGVGIKMGGSRKSGGRYSRAYRDITWREEEGGRREGGREKIDETISQYHEMERDFSTRT